MNTLPLILWATVALSAAFALCYLVARRLNNYGIVDIAWSYAFAGLAAFYAFAGPGWPVRRALLAVLVTIWSLRLGTHLLIRVAHHHPIEDTRYTQLRRDWAGHFASRMFGFFQLQAVSVILLGIAFLISARNPHPHLNPLEIAGTALWLIALAGEACADAQLAAFKKDPTQHGRVCTVGLWHYSRHPNYFFEWLIWVAYFLFALGSPAGGLAVIGPAGILFLLLRVTGIPMAEAQSLRSKGNAYRHYQKTTNAFVPWFPKK